MTHLHLDPCLPHLAHFLLPPIGRLISIPIMNGLGCLVLVRILVCVWILVPLLILILVWVLIYVWILDSL